MPSLRTAIGRSVRSRLNVGIGAMAVASIAGGLVYSSELYALAERWYRALTVVAQVGAGG